MAYDPPDLAGQPTVIHVPEGLTAGERIRRARLASGRSRKATARAIGVSLRTYDRIEADERELRASEVSALAAFTGQDEEFFLGTTSSGDGAGTLPHPLADSKPDNGDEDPA